MSKQNTQTVVLAEDDDRLRSLIWEVLTVKGYRVLEASDGVRLVRLVAEGGVDAVLLDVRLGADDGIALGRELRELEPDLPIALLSGDSSGAEAIKRAVGLTDRFLAKPFAIADLTAMVEELLDSSRR